MRKLLLSSIVTIVFLVLALVCLETYLSWQGYGNPPLYQYDPAVGYVLKRSQDLSRVKGCSVRINNLGMRSPDTTATRPENIYRVLVVGDSVPFGGSYIDQEDTFCYVAERNLNAQGKSFEILNAGVNAHGPQNVRRYLETRGTYESNLVIVFFPWGNLRRDFANFYIVPFWHNRPGWATAEFFRHAIWMAFGKFSHRWKEINAFENELSLTQNLNALAGIKDQCDRTNTPVVFFWSPYRDILLSKASDDSASDVAKLRHVLPAEVLIDLGPMFQKHADISSLYEDGCHYSKAGHHFVGKILADFVRSREKRSALSKSTLTRDDH